MHAGTCIVAVGDDLTAIVDIDSLRQRYSQRGIDQSIEIHHPAVAVKKGMKKGVRAQR